MADKAKIAQKRRIRAGHRSSATKLMNKIKQRLEDGSAEEDKQWSKQSLQTLREKVESLKVHDNQIVELIGSLETEDVEAQIEKEIEDSDRVREELNQIVLRMEEVLSPPSTVHPNPMNVVAQHHSENPTPGSSSQHNVKAKLPKLEVKKFSGRLQDWQEFWDTFQSSIDQNESLSAVDKFSYLRNLLQEPARSTIAGFALTGANYEAAVQALKQRYGKEIAIQRAHVNDLLQLPPVFSDRDIPRLRKLFDDCEAHFRALKALGVDENTYSSVVVPAIMQKLPENFRLTFTRGEEFLTWSMDQMLQAFQKELNLREDHFIAVNTSKLGSQRDNRHDRMRGGTAHALHTKQNNENCAFCLGKHAHENCQRIKDPKERKSILSKYARCFKCLKKGHRVRECNAPISCTRCGQDGHHISLCVRSDKQLNPSVGEFQVSPERKDANPSAISPSTLHVGAGGRVALQTARAVIRGDGDPYRVRVLFDAGSHRSFITSKAARCSQLPVIRQDWLEISTFGQGSKDACLRDVVDVKVSPIGGQKVIQIEAYVVPEISTIQNGHVELAKGEYPYLKGLWFSDVCKGLDELEIDVLVGADYLWNFQKECTIRGGPDEPVAVETELGWVLSGPMKKQTSNEVTTTQVNLVASVLDEKSVSEVHKLWDLETFGISPLQNEVYQEFSENITFDAGRYSVKLPWKEGHPELPTNYPTSLRRLKSQVARLEKEPEVLWEYAAIIKDQLETGVIERVVELEKAGKVHYLPHQAVIRKEATTTKVRIVYDASSKEKKSGTSLNDCLHVGPSLNPLLYDILLRFRENRIALVGDIEKAFLNVSVDKSDRDCLRFLWLEKPPDMSRIVIYRFCRVVFGLNASPFLLNATLRHHIKGYTEVDPEFVRKLTESFYVDDFVGGGATSEEVKDLYGKTCTRMSEGGFKLRKWLTNDCSVREKIQTDSVAKEPVKEIERHVSEEDDSYAKSSLHMPMGSKGQKVLGLAWDFDEDTVSLDLEAIAKRAEGLAATKRNTLKLLAGIFDPLGIIGPATITAKILFQDACRMKIGWDEPLDGAIKKAVEMWIESLIECRQITIKRCVYEHVREEVLECSLHGFADASKKGYCAVTYLVYTTQMGKRSKMLTSKTRVAPLKQLSIPRLELLACLILARLICTIKNALSSQVSIQNVKLWSDSMTALHWMQNQGEWKQFVRHRVNEILQLSNKSDWRHCPSEQNPADIGSRGISAIELRDSELWWYGPSWLVEPENRWPAEKLTGPTAESNEETRKAAVLPVLSDTPQGIEIVMEISVYSTLQRLYRVTAWVKRFCFNISRRDKSDRRLGKLNLEEIVASESDWVKAAQRELKKRDDYQQLVKKFGLQRDQEGIVRCKGRLEYSELHPDAKEPIILPKDHQFTVLQIKECHARVLHSGVRSTLAELRSRFWVLKGRQAVKNVLNRCVVCKKMEGRPFSSPSAASLPDFRVNAAPPFSKTGVDFAGPLFVKGKSGEMRKVHIALFTCCVTRAVHLELVEDLSVETFKWCLRKFIARKGVPQLIVSDNAKTFKGVERELRVLFSHPQVKEEMQDRRIQWRFNVERAPWWGGFFERMIGSVKRCLRKVLGNARLSFAELSTVLSEVEATLNSRPLTYDYDNPSEEVLTPAHLIFGRRLTTLPESREVEEDIGCKRRYRYVNERLEHFWRRWHKEYLTDLRESHDCNANKAAKEPKVGDVVVVFEDGAKRNSWKMAVIERLIRGKDNKVRGANVRVISKGKIVRLNRPVQKLYPIEVRENNVDLPRSKGSQVERENPSQMRDRPRRAAALDAAWKTREMINQTND